MHPACPSRQVRVAREIRAQIPDIVEEELLCADLETRTFSYGLRGEPYGLRNYVAVIEVDSLGQGRSRITCSVAGTQPISRSHRRS